MKRYAALRIIVIISLFVPNIPLIFGNGSPEAEKFCSVPDAVWSQRGYGDHIPKSELSQDIIEILEQYPWNADYKKDTLPQEFLGFRLDLNKDGENEYFLEITQFGGSGGIYFIIVSHIRDHWSVIGQFQGSFHLLPIKNGWYPIIVISRGGGEHYTKTLYEFSGNKYVIKCRERFEDGKISSDTNIKQSE